MSTELTTAVAVEGPHPGLRVAGWAVAVAYIGTVSIAAGSFWLSATTLTDLAIRSGIPGGRAWIWPGVVDGLIVIATVVVMVLRPYGPRATRYPWLLLIAATLISVAANCYHAAIIPPDERSLPVVVAAAISAVPPLALLATTHLTVQLHERRRTPALPAAEPTPIATSHVATPRRRPRPARRPREQEDRAEARRLSAEGASNRSVARELRVHPSTVGRWLRDDAPAAESVAHHPGDEGGADEARP